MKSDSPLLQPYDQHNQKLHQNVHPPDWQNPEPTEPYHLVAIGAGAAGLVTVAGAAGLGARVAIIERELLGGDCLNVGCVPSKALIAAAKSIADSRKAVAYGVSNNTDHVDFAKIMEEMREKRAEISPADSVERFSNLGVDVFLGSGAFVDDSTIKVTRHDGKHSELNFKKAVITTGARAAAPSIKGLEKVDYLTNETLFSLTELPQSMAILGGGPIGCEMAQTFARFGTEVTLMERSDRLLKNDDPQAAEIIRQKLVSDGVNVMLECQLNQLSKVNSGIHIAAAHQNSKLAIVAEKLLIAAGRAPNTKGLGLQNVGVEFDSAGVKVSDHLQTTNPRIFAAGDVCSPQKFTHAADFQARVVIQNALFAIGPLGKRRASDLLVPWATYTSPEVAHVGLTQALAESKSIAIDTYNVPLDDVDRAIVQGETDGFIKIHTRRGTDKIVGATIVAESAGDLICELTLAMQHHIGLSKIAATIHPYPTIADAIRKAGDQFNRTKLTPLSKRILKFLLRLNVGR